MTVINQLIKKLGGINDLCEALKTAEKAESIEIKADANTLFTTCFAEFCRTQETVNNIKSGDKLQSELHVLVAECAFKTENYAVSRQVLQRFLQQEPQLDQFYCRAKVLLGLLINYECRHMNGNESIKWHKYAAAEIMTALDVSTNAKNAARYKFMIFNISVAFWTVVHPFLRPNRAKFFVAEIKRVVAALEEQNDPDKDWRVMYLSAAAVCAEDDKNVATASEHVDKAIEHADALLQVTLSEEEKLNAILKDASAEKDRIMIAFRQIEEQEILRNKPKKIDPDAPPDDPNVPPEPRVLPPLTGLAAEGYDKVKAMLDISQAKKAVADSDLRVVVDRRNVQLETLLRLYLQRVSVNPADAKRFSTLPAVLKYIRASSLVNLQCMIVNAIPDKEWDATFAGLIKKLSETPASVMRNETLADLSRGAWRLKQRKVAVQCCELALEGNIVSKVLKVKTDVCAALKVLSDLALDSANEVTGNRLSVKQAEGYFITKRIEGVKALDSALQACGKLENNQFLSQEICVLMWNAMVPLLQPHLRARVHTSLKVMAAALRNVASPLAQLRYEVHAELAKCEDAAKAVVNARDQATTALSCDYGSLDKDGAVNASNQRDGPSTIATAGVGALSPDQQSLDRNRYLDLFVLPYLNLLEMRCLVYDSPGDIEGQVLLWLHQAKESNLKPFIQDNAQKSLFLMLDLFRQLNGESGGRELLKRNAAGAVDFNALVAAKGPVVIAPVPIEDLEKLLLIPRTGDKYTLFTPVLQLHHKIMYTIATLGHLLENVNILQRAAVFVLTPVWDGADPFVRELVDAQVHVQYLLADNIPVRIKALPFKKAAPKDGFLDLAVARDSTEGEEVDYSKSVDPRCLGFHSDEVSEETRALKRMVVLFLEKGASQAVSVKDMYAVQNGIIFFWNLHVHIFRHNLFKYALDELPKFIISAIAASDALIALSATTPAGASGAAESFDHRLRQSLLETQAAFFESKGMYAEAIEAANKGAGGGAAAAPAKGAKGAAPAATEPEVPEYLRKKACELSSRLVLVQATSGAAAKGGKIDPPVFGNSFLNVFSVIVQAEQPAPLMAKDTAVALVNKAIELLERDVESDLSVTDFNTLSQERFSQLIEMQVEAWTRLTRLRMLFGDTIGSQYTAEKCLNLVSVEHISKTDEAFLNPRVWRWISVCERFFGLAVAAIIQPTGQDLSLQCDLRFVALDHFSLACDNAIRANNEQLVVEAATNAWNISMPLIDMSALRERLYPIQRQIIDNLIQCKGIDPVVRAAVDKLRQQFFLAMIEGYANVYNWDAALKTVLEAFAHVSTALQKPLWQWRVITLSKKGRNVLDGIQKLKEGDPSLQAQVYGILARASSNPQQQLESYAKAIEVLSVGLGQMERVDYMLELAQWMGSNGVPGADITLLVQTALDALYEVEEQGLPQATDADADADDSELGGDFNAANTDTATQRSTKAGLNRSNTGTRAGSVNGSVRGLTKAPSVRGKGSAVSVAASTTSKPALGPDGKPIEEEKLPPRLDFKMLEQCVRALTMQSMLESTQAKRLDKHLEAVYFLRKSLDLWMDSLYLMFRKQGYAALKPEQRGEAPAAVAEPAKGAKGAPVPEVVSEIFATFESFVPPKPDFLCPPQEPVLFIAWLANPSQQMVDLMVLANSQSPDDVPNKITLPAIQLSMHYLLVLADGLRTYGHCKYALLVYAYCRMLLLYVTPAVTGTAAVLSAVHFQCTTLLLEMGLPTEALALPQLLPIGEFTTPAAGTKPVTALTVGAYLIKYVTENTAGAAEAILKPEKSSNKPISAFGFSTWTPVLTFAGGFDAPAYLLQVCGSLLMLGQVQQSHSLVLSVEKDFTQRGDERLLIQTTSLLARISFLNGRYEDAVSMILARRVEMDQAGDAKELAQHTDLLVQAYLKQDNLDEARQVALLSLQLLEDVSLKMIDKSAIQQQAQQNTAATSTQQLGGATSKATIKNSRASIAASVGGNSRANTAATRKTGTKGGAPGTSSLLIEASLQNITAYLKVLRSYVSVTLQAAAQMVSDSVDPRPLYIELCERLGRCAELMADVAGEMSGLVVEVLTLRASAAVEFLSLLHQRASGVVTPVEEYSAWMNDNVLMCVEYMHKVVDMNNSLAQGIPAGELTYTSEKLIADARASSTGQVTKVPYKEISNPVVRTLALSQLQLAYVHVVQAVISGDHISRTANDAYNAAQAQNALTAIDKFLEVTKPPPTFDLSDFAIAGLTKAAQLLSDCSRLLGGAAAPDGTAVVSSIDAVVEVDLLRSAALMLQQHREGLFDCMWGKPIVLSTGKISVTNSQDQTITTDTTATIKAKAVGGSPAPATRKSSTAVAVVDIPEPVVAPYGDAALSAEAKEARTALVDQTRSLVPRCSTQCASAGLAAGAAVSSSRLLQYACLALVEAFGTHRPASGAMWLLQMHSVASSTWLRTVWRDYALNPTGAVAGSVSRLEELCARNWPCKGPMLQILAEQELLNSTSVAFKRLSFAADPLDIVRACPTNLVFLCLQYCPAHNTLYACAGLRTPAGAEDPARKQSVVAAKGGALPTAAAADSVPIKDAFWAFDKMELSETQRRSMQILLQQHKSWLAEATKFIATYGESAPTDCDLEGTTSKFESHNLRKAERALEEKLRALVADLEALLSPLMGPGSKAFSLLQSLLGVNTSNNTGVLKDVHPSLMLLVDPTLQSLPWEALQLPGLFNGRVCRDFSLHMMHHRMQTLAPAPAAGAPAAAPAAGTVPGAVSVTAAGLKYIVDPLAEDEYTGTRMQGLERVSITQAVKNLIAGTSPAAGGHGMLIPAATLPPVPGSQKWTAVRSQNGTASLQDFIVSVDAATPAYAKSTAGAPAAAAPAAAAGAAVVPAANASLLVYALGRLAGSLPPVEIANMDLRQLVLFLCLDMGQNDASSRRQMSADVLKTPHQIASEQPLYVTAMASLSGVGSLLTHTWSTPINAQNRFLRLFMQKFAVATAAAATGAVPVDVAARTLLSAVAAAGYTPALPTSTATRSAAPKSRKASTKILRSESADDVGAEEDPLDGGVSVAESVDTQSMSVAGSTVTATGPAAYPIKKWIRLARVVYGVPFVTYSDA